MTGLVARQTAPSTATPSNPSSRHSATRAASIPPSAIASARRGSASTARRSAAVTAGSGHGGNIVLGDGTTETVAAASQGGDAIIGQGVLIFRGGVEWPMLLGVRETGSSHM